VIQLKVNNGWLHRFCRRYNITARRITEGGKNMPHNMSEIIRNHIGEVNNIIETEGKHNYTLNKYCVSNVLTIFQHN